MTQLRLAALAKVSRSTVVRFEANSGDIQLSSALRILSVVDMVDRKQEGNLLLRREGKSADSPVVAMFAPYTGPGGAMEPKHLGSLRDLKSFLDNLQIDPEVQRRAVADLEGMETMETAIIPNVRLSMTELQEHWPIQFSKKSGESA